MLPDGDVPVLLFAVGAFGPRGANVLLVGLLVDGFVVLAVGLNVPRGALTMPTGGGILVLLFVEGAFVEFAPSGANTPIVVLPG